MDKDWFHHVRDSSTWELPKFVLDLMGRDRHVVLPFGLTKYMVLQVVAGLLVLIIFRGLAKRTAGGRPAKGSWWNLCEVLALYIRDEVVRPLIGIPHHDHDGGNGSHDGDAHHESAAHHTVESHVGHVESGAAVTVGHPADKYLPYVWTVFFYVLFCNLLGAIPLLGSPTANINVTGVLALVTFVHIVMYGSQVSGFGGFLKALAPPIDIPGPAGVIINWFVWMIEAVGFLIKHIVLAIRLFANIMAGHTVLAVFLTFIAIAEGPMWGLVMPASILAQIGIGILELFFGFLQAYVFALLTSLFISMAVNPH